MGEGVTGDYIRAYIGLMGSGKTTQAIRDIEHDARVVVFCPGCSNESLRPWPWIYDTPEYINGLGKYLSMYPKLRVEKKAFPSEFFKSLSKVTGTTILLDDIATLKTNGQERADFDAFIRTVRINKNRVLITTHRAVGDLSPLVRNIATSIYYVGPGTKSKKELQTLYELTNYPISYEEFSDGLNTNPPLVKSGNSIVKLAGIFPIRRA